MVTSSIEAVLFDFGGVFTGSPFQAIDKYAAAQGVDRDDLMLLVFGSYHADTDHPWHQCERGELGLVEAFTQITASATDAGIRFDAGELFSGMADDPYDRTIVVDYVRSVRARGIRTAVVTNNVAEYGSTWRTMIPIDELFDAVIDSCEIGVRKPNPAIYHTALEQLGVTDPSRAVFLDDFEGNVIAARELGLHGIVVGYDPQPALDELTVLLEAS